MRRIIWLYGRPGSGKTTISVALRATLTTRGYEVCLLDSDHMRLGPNIDLGFDVDDRTENVERLAQIALVLSKRRASPFVIVSAVTPLPIHRRLAMVCDPLLVCVMAQTRKKLWLGTVFEEDESLDQVMLALPGLSPDHNAIRIVQRLQTETLQPETLL